MGKKVELMDEIETSEFLDRSVLMSWVGRLIDDVIANILNTPFNVPLKVHSVPPSTEKETAIANFFDSRNSNLELTIRDFFQICAANIIAYGNAKPLEISREKKIAKFSIPYDLNNKLKELRGELFDLGPQSASPMTANFNKKLIEVGKPIGWNTIFTLDPDQWTAGNLINYLKFQKFVIELREYILINLLNVYAQDISSELGFSAQIKIEGLITVENIIDLEEQFINDKKSFNDVIKFKID